MQRSLTMACGAGRGTPGYVHPAIMADPTRYSGWKADLYGLAACLCAGALAAYPNINLIIELTACLCAGAPAKLACRLPCACCLPLQQMSAVQPTVHAWGCSLPSLPILPDPKHAAV